MGFDYTIVRSARRTISISVSLAGKVVVRAPHYASLKVIENFVEEKSNWIVEKLNAAKVRLSNIPSLEDGEQLHLLSKYYTLHIAENKRGEITDDKIILPYAGRERALKLLASAHLKAYLLKRVAEIATCLGFKYKSISIGSACNRWATCAADNSLRFSFRCAFLDVYVLDYIIVHELCHTIHKNHGKLFWKKVAACMPDYKIRRNKLHDYNYLCTFLKVNSGD